jgi:SAM-dependent methyltransferase
MNYNKPAIYLEWDVSSWRPVLRSWADFIDRHFTEKPLKGLEIGARNGGVTLFFAERVPGTIYCTDVKNPEAAKTLHQKFSLKSNIVYEEYNMLRPKYESNTFDYIVFKSLLGVIGKDQIGDFENQIFAIEEIYRMLKPGGVLFFAENLKASFLHQWSRKIFIAWGNKWRYVSLAEMNNFLNPFSKKEIKTTGFLTAFTKFEKLKPAVHLIDKIIHPAIPASCHYISYGYAIK